MMSMNSALRRLARSCVVGLLGFALAAPTWAAPQYCAGTVSQLWVDADGNLFALPSWRGDHVRLCHVRTAITANSVTIEPVTCLAWMALVRQAMTANKQVSIHYADIPQTCSQVPTYAQSPLPWYVMLVN